MKTLTTFILAATAIIGANAQSWKPTVGVNYGFALPTGGMKPYIRNGNGVNINFMAEAPSKRIAAGLEFGLTGYGHSKASMEYTFDDGSTAPMNLIVNNNYISLMAATRLYFVLDGPVRPYATFKAGYTWFITDLKIVDPNDADSCTPVESNMLSSDGTFAYSAGGGLNIDMAWMFKKMRRGTYYIDISSNILQGGRVDFMNEDPPAAGGSHNSTTRAKAIDAPFIDTQTQVVHNHHVGYMYNTFVQIMDFRLGMNMKFGN